VLVLIYLPPLPSRRSWIVLESLHIPVVEVETVPPLLDLLSFPDMMVVPFFAEGV